jgi:hypothetical protein
MLPRRKQKLDDDEHLIPHVWTWQATKCEGDARSKSRTTDFSKLSAQLVELSLQEAQRDPTLRGAVPNKLSAASSPLLWPSPDVQRIAQPPAENTGGPGTAARKAAVAATPPLSPPQAHGTPRKLRLPDFAVLFSRATVLRGMTNYSIEVPRILGSWVAGLRVSGSVAVGNLRVYLKSVQKDHRLATLRARVLGRLTIEAQRTELILQRTAILIGRWSRWTATTAQFLAERISAKLWTLRHSQPLQRLRLAWGKNLRVLTARALVVRAVIEKKFLAYRGSRPAVLTKRATGRRHLNHK